MEKKCKTYNLVKHIYSVYAQIFIVRTTAKSDSQKIQPVIWKTRGVVVMTSLQRSHLWLIKRPLPNPSVYAYPPLAQKDVKNKKSDGSCVWMSLGYTKTTFPSEHYSFLSVWKLTRIEKKPENRRNGWLLNYN